MRAPILAVLLLLSISAMAQEPPDVKLQAVAAGISELNLPLVGLKHAGDGSGRIFIVDQDGRVWVIDSSGALLADPFVDIGGLVISGGERGLLDIAFHPEYTTAEADGEDLFYLHFSSNGSAIAGTDIGDTVVAEFSVTDDPNIANNTPDRIILTVSQDFSNHNGGQMKFGPNGNLHIALGDGGSANDPCNRAQTLDPANLIPPGTGNCAASDASMNDSLALLGKILRINVNQPTEAVNNDNLCGVGVDNAAPYSVPAENPFANQDGRCGEVFLYGLRNPWRFSFDRATDDLWIGDVGQGTWEEVDLLPDPIPGGDNLGWKVCEGNFEANSDTDPCPLPNSVRPLLTYRNTGFDGDCSVTGGYRYRGPVISLQGRYIYGDFCSGKIWFADKDSGEWEPTLTGFNESKIRSFGEDEAGNVYVIAGRDLFRFEGDTALIFADGFEQQ